MANSYYGKTPLGELSDAQALPNATAVDSTNMVYVGGKTGGSLWINVYANTTIVIATAQAFSIEFQSFSTDTAASAISPFSTANKGGIYQATGTSEDEAHIYLLHKTSTEGELNFAAGDLMCSFGIPEDMLRLLSHDYVQLVYTTDADESAAEKVDAFVWVKPA